MSSQGPGNGDTSLRRLGTHLIGMAADRHSHRHPSQRGVRLKC